MLDVCSDTRGLWVNGAFTQSHEADRALADMQCGYLGSLDPVLGRTRRRLLAVIVVPIGNYASADVYRAGPMTLKATAMPPMPEVSALGP